MLRASRIVAAVVIAAPLSSVLAQSSSTLLFRQPALSATEICFSYAGDIWLVPRTGGVARRLTSSEEPESDCKFSPDGRWVAYTGRQNLNNDVYVISTSGGTPNRLTWHPGSDIVRGWTPDGRVVFVSGRMNEAPGATPPRLFVQAVDAVIATPVDLPSGFDGAFAPDGKRIAYMPIQNANDIWKRYRGGRTTPIWIATLSDAAIVKIPRDSSTDKTPMWVGDTVFFLSDRDGTTTLWSYDVNSKRVTRRIQNDGLDIKSASAGPGGIVYEQFGAIKLFDLRNGQSSAVPIQVSGEIPDIAPHWVRVSDKLRHPALSPTGVRAAFEARGEILTVPAKKGNARIITNTVDAVERFPAWSPDGQTLAYFSDAGGDGYHIDLRAQNGLGTARTLKLGEDDTYYYSPLWAPDGKSIAYTNSRGEIFFIDVATGKIRKVDTDPQGPQGGGGVLTSGMGMSWSPDSKWLAYGRSIRNRLGAVFVYDVVKSVSTQVTDGMSDTRFPAFDPNGKYLYFVASTDAGPASDFSMTTFDHPVTRNLYAIVLRKDLPSPMAPESDEEKAKTPGAAAGGTTSAASDSATRAKAAAAVATDVRIDFDAIDQRTIALPMPARDYFAVASLKSGSVILAEAPFVPVDLQSGPSSYMLYKYDVGERKTDRIIEDIAEFDFSRDGEKLLYRRGSTWTIAPLGPARAGQAPPPAQSTDTQGPLATADLNVYSDPRAEWKQMYHEAFRFQRAFFYDPSYHGLDLAATEHFYARYLDGLSTRSDLDYVFQEAFGNLTVGHLFVGPAPPDTAGVRPLPRAGLLGADYVVDNGRWKFARVYAGESWNPQFRAPLTQPGVNVRAGEYLLAVNGRELTAKQSVDQALDGTAGTQVVLRVGPNANGTGARDVTVEPLASEAPLRHLAWIDNNRRTVDKLSGGKLAYIYVPNTAGAGYTRFNRYFFSQQDKQGAVVDERYNGGGNIADYMVQYLARSAPFNYVTSRYGVDTPVPAGGIYGPKIMLINQYAGSGGDELPWLFRRFNVGPLVGTRTWGGLVGIGGYPQLMDGGSVTAPRVALWAPEGDYAVENRGVAPDIEVEMDPAAWRAGHDTQLERAVALLMQSNVIQAGAKRPAFPTWAKGKTPKQ